VFILHVPGPPLEFYTELILGCCVAKEIWMVYYLIDTESMLVTWVHHVTEEVDEGTVEIYSFLCKLLCFVLPELDKVASADVSKIVLAWQLLSCQVIKNICKLKDILLFQILGSSILRFWSGVLHKYLSLRFSLIYVNLLSLTQVGKLDLKVISDLEILHLEVTIREPLLMHVSEDIT